MSRNILILLLLFSCRQQSRQPDPYHWYEETKTLILSESNLPADSTSVEKYDDGKTHVVTTINNGHPTVKKMYRETGEQAAQTSYSRDGQFELREEICGNGIPAFEGIFYRGKAYGPSTWWRCDKSKKKEGIRYNDEKIGVWKDWDDDGKVTQTDYENDNFADSLQLISIND